VTNGLANDGLPTVSVIIPVRNEEEYIAECLQSVVDQDYPKELMEVLVVDGMSQDSSREIVSDIAEKCRFVTLLHNPKQVKAAALNKGIGESRGQLILPVDAHCFIAPDYVSECVNALHQTAAANVGGVVLPIGTSFVQRAIGLGMSSFFGIGSVRFQDRENGFYTDTVSFGAYRREVFGKIGLYDEEAHYGEDDELNLRLVKSGGKIFLSPRIKSRYYPRSSFSALWKQYYNFGYGKVRTIRKHGRAASFRHLVPPFFVLCVVGSLLLFAIHPMFLWLTITICGTYVMSAIILSAKIGYQEGWKYLPALPVVFATLHFSYGIGLLNGFLNEIFRLYLRLRCRDAKDVAGK
jgi:cellulose synthase/poly-beta-1,6-N-acetylglucosamine synthase-like glycosyltransferase